MHKIMFVCHGNICRSPMAEFVMRDIVKKSGMEDKFHIASSATSTEEIGNPVHYGTREILSRYNISTKGKFAIQFTKADYNFYDYIIAMDSYNIRNLMRLTDNDPEHKIYKLKDFTSGGDVADPWYTGNFEETYRDVLTGCNALFEKLKA